MENKDLNLKLMCKILYKNIGFNAHYEIKLRNKSYITHYKTHDISDIDVLGYKFNANLSSFLIGSECKSGENNAIDELYKFLGIARTYNLDKAYLIKTKIHQNAREIALDNNTICYTESELRILLNGFDINLDKQISIENAKYHKLIKNIEYYKEKNERLIEYLTLDYWNKESWRNVHNLIYRLSKSNNNLISLIDNRDKYIMYYTLELFALSLLKCIHSATILNYSDFEKSFIACLYGGADSLNERRRIQDAVNIATNENIKFEAEWQDDLTAICSRIITHSKAAAMIPTLIQEIYEYCIFEKEVIIDKKMLKRYPDITRKYTQDIMHFLIKHTDNNYSEYFKEFLAL